jgi:hypothetical protein
MAGEVVNVPGRNCLCRERADGSNQEREREESDRDQGLTV